MKWTSLNDLREKYLAFFERKGHIRLPSFSLIPNNDKSLLLINSGMAPMKKFFTGEEQPPRKPESSVTEARFKPSSLKSRSALQPSNAPPMLTADEKSKLRKSIKQMQ